MVLHKPYGGEKQQGPRNQSGQPHIADQLTVALTHNLGEGIDHPEEEVIADDQDKRDLDEKGCGNEGNPSNFKVQLSMNSARLNDVRTRLRQ